MKKEITVLLMIALAGCMTPPPTGQSGAETKARDAGSMSLNSADMGQVWRWILIAAEAFVAVHLGAVLVAGRKVRVDLGLIEAVLFFVAWLFLFLGSPFLVRRHGWLAIVGWAIGVSGLLIPRL